MAMPLWGDARQIRNEGGRLDGEILSLFDDFRENLPIKWMRWHESDEVMTQGRVPPITPSEMMATRGCDQKFVIGRLSMHTHICRHIKAAEMKCHRMLIDCKKGGESCRDSFIHGACGGESRSEMNERQK